MDNDDYRQRVIAAADRLYYTKGFSAVGMDQLRDAAGISLRRLYQLFPSKNDVVTAVLQNRRKIWADGLTEYMDAAPTPRGKLLAVYDFLADWFCEDDFRGCGFINAFAELGAVNSEIAAIAREHKMSFQRHMARLVAEIGAAPSLAHHLMLLAEGAQTTAALTGDPSAAHHARQAAEILIDTALAKEHPNTNGEDAETHLANHG
ncbi:TetR/AcrR family transcriptional regulator [Allosalinactinospora lopnorensis]|uniref:TetR/AcrR family transcriptional regulator n=1 Tax=Allosalinactinospora lopnorensis TaxID=1352348 RepID=UPI000623FFEC|nr:TetR/AcrR family transcriptional regulator [Allosalinactinospora lopnorensis]